jgi:hypothetical protein
MTNTRHTVTALLMATAMLLAGCMNNLTAVKTLLATGETVNAAMNVYGELHRAGALTAEETASVRTKHETYRLAYAKAVELVGGDLSKMTPAEVGALASDLVIFIHTLKNRKGL